MPYDPAPRLLAWCRATVDSGITAAREAAAGAGLHDVIGHDLALAAGRVEAAERLLDVAATDLTAALAFLHAGQVASELHGLVAGRSAQWPAAPSDDALEADLTAARDPALLDDVGRAVVTDGVPWIPYLPDEDLPLVRATFHDFADARVAVEAERIHRNDADVPETLITELAGMGAFGLSIPETYGGAVPADGDRAQALASMLVVTEELSRASLGAAGSLITRPEMLASALLDGGTEAQRERWLPAIAAGERMCAIAVTEPDHGSDVANLRMRAEADGGDYVLNGTKTWCTFAGRAELVLLIARTGTEADGHRGLSAFVLEKPPYAGHAWVHEPPGGGRIDARAIPTIGYRGMHSFELSFDDVRVPAANLIGEDQGVGRGFYLQMGAFATGRLQTAARAVGLMQAAVDAARAYAGERRVFGTRLADLPLSRAKLAWMGAEVAAGRALAASAASRHADPQAASSAALAKAVTCAAAERVTREAQQLHGGMGYAEEFAVSRYFVDARVLSIFEGAQEVLALRVILPQLLRG